MSNSTTASNLQELFNCITGHEPAEPYSSARNDYYFDLETKAEKIEQLISYAENYLCEAISEKEAQKVYQAIECHKETPDDWTEAYNSLA